MAVIGLDLGGTKLAGALFDARGEIISRKVQTLEGRQGKEVGNLIFTLTASLLENAVQQDQVVTGIGLSVPGIAYVDRGEVWAPNIPGWESYPIIAELKSRLDQPGLPVILESDRSCYILGEQWKGLAQGCRHAIYMAVGTGIGVGILTDGHLLRGSGNIAGAIGWMALNQTFLAPYSSVGCYEYHASGTGLAKVAEAMLDAGEEINTRLNQLDRPLTSRDIFTFYEKKDPLAVKVIDQAIVYWGMATANLVSIFNPEKIIFGGGVFGPAGQFLERIRTEAYRWAQPISMRQVSLEVSQLGGDAGLIGAGYLALRDQQA